MALFFLILLAFLIYYLLIERGSGNSKNMCQSEKKCPTCHNPVEDSFNLCPICKETLKKACPHCGEKVQIGWRFCPFCGKTITRAANDEK